MKFLTSTSGAVQKASVLMVSCLVFALPSAQAKVTLEKEIKISDSGLHFDGRKLRRSELDKADPNPDGKFDFFFGPQISAHGDSVKSYRHFVFTTWYHGGKDNRHVMLSRYNTKTGDVKHIEFPHQHTGFVGNRLVGESHNRVSVAISPLNGTIHLLYDMHAYHKGKPADGSFANDFFRYSYSVTGAADVSDKDFSLDLFVKDTSDISEGDDDYKHLTMTGDLADRDNFSELTYPTFFTNTDGTLLVYMRKGGNNNGGYVFNRYDAKAKKWSRFVEFNKVHAKRFGNDYNWGLYGHMKYVNGKLRVGFQQRSANNSDKFKYQNGVYYAYSDHPEGFGDWKNHRGEAMTFPLVDSAEIKVFEPGDYISHTQPNSVNIVDGFDWTVTERGDLHMISKVKSSDKKRKDYEEVYLHSYKPKGAEEFTITTDFAGASNIYTAGDDIYIIGLDKKGRPYVERAKGGTNNFKRVYHAKKGKKFSHGRVYIKNGMLYYYLMEQAKGSERPLYLQMIDLDIDA